MLKTFVRTTTCLAVSAAALIAVTTLDAIAGKGRSPAVPETTEPKPAPRSPAPKPTEPPAKLTVASLALPDVGPATTRNRAGSGLTVPDWKGKRLSVARREARKLGLNVTAVDESGEAVAADEASSYRVRRMLTRAGTTVEPGGEVEVRVREIVGTAMGY
jgi:ribosomal protein L13E